MQWLSNSYASERRVNAIKLRKEEGYNGGKIPRKREEVNHGKNRRKLRKEEGYNGGKIPRKREEVNHGKNRRNRRRDKRDDRIRRV